jgi:mRNA interferase MazF
LSSPVAAAIRRGEVYGLDFAPATGSGMSGIHPCVIVQNDIGNQHSALTIVAAVTSNLRVASLPIGVLLKAGEGGPPHDAVVHCGHVYTVDKKRLRTRLGQLTPIRIVDVDKALACSMGL